MGELELQRALQVDAYGVDPAELVGAARAEYIRDMMLAAVNELMEALEEVQGWKPWTTLHPDDRGLLRDPDAFIEEMVDVKHFINNLLLVAGATDEEVERVYAAKRAKNKQRQEEGYRV